MRKFIAVAGNIGVGKSTLVSLLSQRLGWKAFYEPVEDNPYLPDFYQDMKSWAFHSQIFFLTRRLRIHKQLVDFGESAIQDRSVYEDAEIFARNLYLQDQINDRDYQAYRDLYQVLVEFLPAPDLVLYLRAEVPTLLHRIQVRGREYERQISGDYLAQLNTLYENWFAHFNLCPVLAVPADDLHYEAIPAHLELIIKKINEKLTGKDEVVFEAAEIKA